MSLWRQRSPSTIRSNSSRQQLALYSLISLAVVWAFTAWLAAPPPEDYQIAVGFGDRYNNHVLVLKPQPDGQVLWPDGSLLNVADSQAMLQYWHSKHPDDGLAIYAPANMHFSAATPLLDAAKQCGITRAVIAIPRQLPAHQ